LDATLTTGTRGHLIACGRLPIGRPDSHALSWLLGRPPFRPQALPLPAPGVVAAVSVGGGVDVVVAASSVVAGVVAAVVVAGGVEMVVVASSVVAGVVVVVAVGCGVSVVVGVVAGGVTGGGVVLSRMAPVVGARVTEVTVAPEASR